MDTAFFILSKLIGLALQIETWLMIGMVVSLVAGRFARPRLARWSGSVTLVTLLAVCIFPIGEILLRPLEAEFPPRAAPAHIDGIVVLGGVEDQRATTDWRDPQLNEAAERLTAAASLAITHPEARLVFSGGSGRLRNAMLGQPEIPSVAVDFFMSLDIDPARFTWGARSPALRLQNGATLIPTRLTIARGVSATGSAGTFQAISRF